MLDCQKDLFQLPSDLIYLNGAYMSPNLKAVEQAGIIGLKQKSIPSTIPSTQFFEPVKQVKESFSQLISADDYNRISIIPSVSYGMAIAAKNANLEAGDQVLMIEEQFPSNYYCWDFEAKRHDAHITIVAAPNSKSRGEDWNAHLLEAITPKTKVVTLPIVHWSDGTLFDIERLTKKAHDNGALMIIDGTQSIGALPFSVSDIQVDALICAAYKWLLGPYSIGCGFFGEAFDTGDPIEFSWMNRLNSEDFTGLVNYQSEYKQLAHRYDMGQACNFVAIPMLNESLQQINAWTPEAIQLYCRQITSQLTDLPDSFSLENTEYRSQHLFGIRTSDSTKLENIKTELSKQNISVSFRGDCIRVAPNVYNTKEDIDALISVLQKS